MKKTEIHPILNSEKNQISLSETVAKMDLSNVFNGRRDTYLNEMTLFAAHFNCIPNYICEINIDCQKANNWFVKNYEPDINDFYFSRHYIRKQDKAELDDIFYFLFEDLLVDFDTNQSIVRFLFRKTDLPKVEEVVKGIHKFKKRIVKGKPEILLLYSGMTGIETVHCPIKKPKLNIIDNYNDDFQEIHQTIIKRLSRKNDKGLVVLHGKPGTGKTSYIRYLIASLKKNVIFLPPNMASAITNPELISILVDHPNSILVIEDAENIVVDREKDGNSPVSALLNISDGLLADSLNVQIICSFNTDISKIDGALMRKGRLIAKYEFKELEIEKAQKLSNKLGFKTQLTEPMSLTAIYNQEDKDFQEAKKGRPIGFQTKKT